VFDRESGAWEAIRKILRRFRPFEEEEAGGSTLLGGGGGMSTVLVAASDSLDIDKAKADYVCTGVNDQDIIQQAIDLVNDFGGFGPGGGTVWLAPGTYNVEVPASGPAIDVKTGVTLRGFEPGAEGATYIQPSNTSDPGSGGEVIRLRAVTTMENVTVYAFYSYPTIRLDDFDSHIRIVDCYLENWEGACIAASGNDFVWVERCFLSTGYGADDTTSAIYVASSATDWWISHNYITGGYHGVFFDSGSSAAGRINILNNYVLGTGFGGIVWIAPDEGCAYGVITGNQVFGVGSNASGGTQFGAIHLESNSDGTSLAASGDSGSQLTAGTLVHSNIIEGVNVLHGVMVDGAIGHQIVNNWIENASQHGVYLLESSDCQVRGNDILWPDGTSDTYDGIHLAAGSSIASKRNYVVGNRVYDTLAGTPSYWRYGINVAGTACYDNIIVGNDLRYTSGATGTAIANSAGTATLLSWPSHGTYGDNFT